MPTLTALAGAATAVYSATLVAVPRVLIEPCGLADSADTRALTRLVGARDTGIGLAMVLAPAGTARRLAVGARVLSDWTDAVVLSRSLAGRGTRAKVVGFAVLWGAFCLGALAVDES